MARLRVSAGMKNPKGQSFEITGQNYEFSYDRGRYFLDGKEYTCTALKALTQKKYEIKQVVKTLKNMKVFDCD